MYLYKIKNKTVNSAIWYTISNMLAKAMSVILTPVLARLLTTQEYGVYTNFVSWQNVLVILFSLELSSTVMRAKFDYNESEFYDYVFSVCCFSILFPMLVAGLVLLFGYKKIESILSLNYKLVMALYIIVIFYPLLQIFQAEQRAAIKYKISSFVTLLFSGSSLVLPIIFANLFKDRLCAVSYSIAIVYLLFGIIFFVYYFRKTNARKINISYLKYALVIALPIVPHLISSVIMGNSDKVMITKMCGFEYSAMYGVVYTSALAVTLFRNSLNNAWVPWLYEQLDSRKNDRIKSVSRLFIIAFSIMTIFICLMGPEIVIFLGGKKYEKAAIILPFIMLGCYYNFLSIFYVNIEFYKKKTAMISVITIITATANVVLNYVGIKLIGYQAAAIATAVCNGLTVLFHYFVTKKWHNDKICNNKLILICSVLGIMIAMIISLLYKCHILLRILVIIAYLAVSTVFCIINKNKIKCLIGKG